MSWSTAIDSDLYPLIERNVESLTVTVGGRSNIQKTVRSNSFGGRGFTDSSAKMFAVGEKELGRREGREGGRKALRPGRHTLHKSFPRRFAYFAKQNSAKCYPSFEPKRRRSGAYLRIPHKKARLVSFS